MDLWMYGLYMYMEKHTLGAKGMSSLFDKTSLPNAEC